MCTYRLNAPLHSLVLLFALAACKDGVLETAPSALPLGWSEESHTLKGRPDYTLVFPRLQVNRLDLTLHPSDWRALQDDLRELSSGVDKGGPALTADVLLREPLHVPCTVEFSGKKWHHVALFAAKGVSLAQTLRAAVGKLPFGLRFDEFGSRYADARDQRFYGFSALSLGNNANDESLLRQRAAADILRDENVPSPYSAFYRLYVDAGRGPIYFGLYTVVEVPDAPLLDARFGNTDGNLYRVEGSGATFRTFVKSSFIKETNQSAADYRDVKSALSALHADPSDRPAWRAALEQSFDVNGFLNWLAVNTVIENWDSYGMTAHNYFLYADKKDGGVLKWIPWDTSQALRPGPGGPLSLSLKEVGTDWPLIRYLMDDPVYRETYYANVAATAEAAFSRAEMEPLYSGLHTVIAPYVTGPQGELKGYTFLRDPSAFERSVASLLDHVNRRQDAVKLALATR